MLTLNTETFDKSIILTRGPSGSAVRRQRLEQKAREDLLMEVRQRGYEPIIATLHVLWMSDFQGRASVDATRADVPSDSSGGRVGFLGGGWP